MLWIYQLESDRRQLAPYLFLTFGHMCSIYLLVLRMNQVQYKNLIWYQSLAVQATH